MNQRSALESGAASEARVAAVRPVAGSRPARPAPRANNPTFGFEYWTLGLLAACPALVGMLAFLAAGARLPQASRVSFGVVLGALIVALALVTLLARFLRYPAWSQPAVALLPTLALFLPAVVLHGQVAMRANGDVDRIVAVPFVITWALATAAAIVAAAAAFIAGRHAPSFAGSALLPLPLILAWVLVLIPSYSEVRVERALASSLALAACATFSAWVTPTRWRPTVPLAAIGAQFALFWWLRLGWPRFSGAVEMVVALDIALYVLLVVLVGVAPFCAAWMRRAGWPEIRRIWGGEG